MATSGRSPMVASSRARGLKLPWAQSLLRGMRRVLTGAWIETPLCAGPIEYPQRRVLTGAWIETLHVLDQLRATLVASSRARGLKRSVIAHAEPPAGRVLTGAWIETWVLPSRSPHTGVASSRARGLKPAALDELCCLPRRVLTGAWIETCDNASKAVRDQCRVLTGAWIETCGQ